MTNPNEIDAKDLTSTLSGVAGEYFVAAELSRRGYIASITLRNSKGVDVLCSSANATKSVGIQVKTSKYSESKWLLNKKSEDYYANNLFYVFVKLNYNQKSPDYFIVPSKVVATATREGHKKWLDTPGKKGQKHNDSSMRVFGDKEGEYCGRWELLGLE